MTFFRKLSILIILITLSGCSTLNIMNKAENNFFDIREREIIDNIAISIDYRRGYDPKLELNYFYAAGKFSPKEYRSRAGLFAGSMKSYNSRECFKVFLKVFEVEARADIKLEEYKKEKDWDNYLYLKKYLIPEIKLFSQIYENNMKKIYPSTIANISMKKKEIQKKIITEIEMKKRAAEEEEEEFTD